MSRAGKHQAKKQRGNAFAFTLLILAAILILGCAAALAVHHVTAPKLPVSSAAAEQTQTAVNSSDTAAQDTQPDSAPAATVSAAAGSADMDALKKTVGDYIAKFDSKWCVRVETLADGQSFTVTNNVSADTPMVSASVIKLFIMGAVYQEIDAGRIREADVTTKLQSMISQSDNAAANEMIKLLGSGSTAAGMKKVNAFASAMGCPNTTLNRLMLVEDGTQNYTTAADCATLLKMICSGECVSPEASKKMFDLLRMPKSITLIASTLPDTVTVADKTGELTGLAENDVGIVSTPNGDYLLCIMSQPNANGAAAKAIGDISKTVYDALG